jgi:hypothetical protein
VPSRGPLNSAPVRTIRPNVVSGLRLHALNGSGIVSLNRSAHGSISGMEGWSHRPIRIVTWFGQPQRPPAPRPTLYAAEWNMGVAVGATDILPGANARRPTQADWQVSPGPTSITVSRDRRRSANWYTLASKPP